MPTAKEQELQVVRRDESAVARPMPQPIELLETALRGEITAEKVGVAERLVAMIEKQQAANEKKSFRQAFFGLLQELSATEIYADKAAETRDRKTAYTYCSERELQAKIEPVLKRHGFSMLFDQRADDQRITAIIILCHVSGHEERLQYSVRPGAVNAMKDAAAADTGATTTAWRHLMIKTFGLKSRIVETDDPRNQGGFITKEQAEELQRRVKLINGDEHKFLAMAGVRGISGEAKLEHYQSIAENKYADMDAALTKKEKAGR